MQMYGGLWVRGELEGSCGGLPTRPGWWNETERRTEVMNYNRSPIRKLKEITLRRLPLALIKKDHGIIDPGHRVRFRRFTSMRTALTLSTHGPAYYGTTSRMLPRLDRKSPRTSRSSADPAGRLQVGCAALAIADERTDTIAFSVGVSSYNDKNLFRHRRHADLYERWRRGRPRCRFWTPTRLR
jgi:hypothetical protein